MQTEARVGVVVEGGAQRALASGHEASVDGGVRRFSAAHHQRNRQQGLQQQPQIGTMAHLLAGGVAGAVSKTCTAPLARLTILFQPEFNGCENLEFPEFYKKTHTQKNKEWIDPICAVKHSKMLSLREESSQSDVQLTSEEMSRQALGKRKRYILGFGVGPKPSSSSSTPQVHVGELQKLKADMEEMKMEREELRRQLEQERREREEERREREEERKEREEEQKQMAHLTSLVTEFLKEKTQTHKSSIHHDGAMYSTGGTNTR